MDLVIRLAKQGDLKTIQDLNKALFEYDKDNDLALNLNWPYEDGETYFSDRIKGIEGVCFVCGSNNEIVGYLVGTIHKNPPSYRPIVRAELENMFVEEDYRGKGVGKKLVDRFKSWCLENEVKNVYVSAYWLNEGAKKFYTSIGFKPYSIDFEQKLK